MFGTSFHCNKVKKLKFHDISPSRTLVTVKSFFWWVYFIAAITNLTCSFWTSYHRSSTTCQGRRCFQVLRQLHEVPKAYVLRVFVGDGILHRQLHGDYFKNHEIRIPFLNNQDVQWKGRVFFFSWLISKNCWLVKHFFQETRENPWWSFHDERYKFGSLGQSTLEETTLPKTSMAPENRPSQKESSIPTIHFQVLC